MGGGKGLNGGWALMGTKEGIFGMSTGCYMLSDESLGSTPEAKTALYVN